MVAEPGASLEKKESVPLPDELERLKFKNARMPSPKLMTGGQLTREQMVSLSKVGYSTFISLRSADETGAGWEEEFAEAEGIEFVRIPVAGPAGITRDNAERLAEKLARAGSEPTVLYCDSGNRVGALLAMKAHLLDGESAEAALAFGKKAGLTRLEPKVRELLSLP
jgi:uncharacterized protein (TIGR01244 family)